MSHVEQFDIGEGVLVEVIDIKDENGVTVEPAEAEGWWQAPDGTVTEATMTKESGRAAFVVTPDSAGDWLVRIRCVNPNVGRNGRFHVRPSFV